MSQLLSLIGRSIDQMPPSRDHQTEVWHDGREVSISRTSEKIVTLYTPSGDLITVCWYYEWDSKREAGEWTAKMILPTGTQVHIKEKDGELTRRTETG